MNQTVGQKLEPILAEIAYKLLESEVETQQPHKFSDIGFDAISTIFMAGVSDKFIALVSENGISLDDACKMSAELGSELRMFIKRWTNIDTHGMYDRLYNSNRGRDE
jgi:hypothetical protein